MINNMIDINWQFLMPPLWIGLFLGLSLVTLAYIAWRGARLPWFRAGFIVLVAVFLLNPVLIRESGTATPTTVIVIVDQTQSQNLSGRSQNVDDILSHVQQGFQENPDIEPLVHYVSSTNEKETYLYKALQDAAADIPPAQLGGAILISDGIVHDIPNAVEEYSLPGPVHVMLNGAAESEYDRRIKVISAPSYAIIGDEVTIKFQAIEEPESRVENLPVTIKMNGKTMGQRDVPVSENVSITLAVPRGGENIVEIAVHADNKELSKVNNTAVIPLEGVRDSLKVLLVSGQPHPGLRSWRNLLKSDPAVELVHFTILRGLNDIDMTPQKDLALIPFPTDELFERRINEFDMIILDRYTRRSILQEAYYQNIVDYVREGGGILVIQGPEEMQTPSLSQTVIGDILPAKILKDRLNAESVLPQLTAMGQKHPVTSPLSASSQNWGHWQRYLSISGPPAKESHTLLSTKDGAPLLIINKEGEGRVGQLLSDQIWLWARGYDGGGPYAETMRRLSHWLMKEPSLTYQPLSVVQNKDEYIIRYKGEFGTISDEPIKVTKPDGTVIQFNENFKKETSRDQVLEQLFTPDLPGLYRIKWGPYITHFIFQDPSYPEYQRLVTDISRLDPLVQNTGGNIVPLDEYKNVDFSVSGESRHYYTGNTLKFLKSRELIQRQTQARPILPWWLAATIGLVLLLTGWRRQE